MTDLQKTKEAVDDSGLSKTEDFDIFDPFDLDREEFNPDLWMSRYGRENSLGNLVARKSNIDNEINNFSINLQTMLYDNYQKFVSVTSVVTNMKVNFQRMEQEMDHLHDKMSGIGKTSSEILENLQPTESRISKLLKCQSAMKKLALLTDLVPTLKMHMNSGACSAAARYYLKAEKLLKKLQHLPSLKGIASDCSEIVVEMRSALGNKLNCEIFGKEELSDTLNLLISLGETPLPVLKRFASCGNKCLASFLTSMDRTWQKDLENECKEHSVNAVMNYVKASCNYVKKMSDVIGAVKSVSVAENNSAAEICVNELLEEFFKANMDTFSTSFFHHMKEKFLDIDDYFLSQILDEFLRQCHVSGILTPQINVYHKGLDIVLQICTSRCEFHLSQIKYDFNVELFKLIDKLSSNIKERNLDSFLEEWTEQRLMAVLESIICYIRPEFRCCREITFRKMFCKVIVREGTFITFFRYIMERICCLLSSEDIKCPPNMFFYLVMVKFHLDLENIAYRFLSKVDDYLCCTSEKLSLTTAEEISLECRNAAQKIMEAYIEIHCNNMTQMLQKSMENKNWMKLKEPTRPRAVIKMILNDIEQTKIEAEKMFDVYSNPPRKKAGSEVGSAFSYRTHSVEGSFECNSIEERVILNKIFTEYAELSVKVEPNAPSILKCLLKKVLNSFIQIVRLKTFNHFSLQQIQVDVCYLQGRISNLIHYNTIIQSLLDEILSSTYNRTLDPQLMNSQVVSFICSNTM